MTRQLLIMLFCLINTPVVMAATSSGTNTGSVDITFSNITAGTCPVTFSSVSANGPVTTSMNLGAVNGDLLVNTNWAIANDTTTGAAAAKNFWILLTNCNAWNGGTGGTQPKIKLTGTLALSNQITGNTYLFSDNAGATGFGVLIFPTQPPNPGTNELANNAQISIPLVPASGALSGTYSIPMSAGVSAGRATWNKTATALRTGSLKASITFTLNWP